MIEAENEELKERVKENKDNNDARLEVVELKQKIEDFTLYSCYLFLSYYLIISGTMIQYTYTAR